MHTRAKLLIAAAFIAWTGAAMGQATPAPRAFVYSCVVKGKPTRAEMPIQGCDSEQRVLNPDGSLHHLLQPTPTEEERAESEAKEREESARKTARQVELRRDKNLLLRYPDKAAHDKARKEALDSASLALKNYEARIDLLNIDRKKLLEEAEFYKGKSMPTKLKVLLDANDASLDATNALIQTQRADVVRIDKNYDDELGRLRVLWAQQPGVAPR